MFDMNRLVMTDAHEQDYNIEFGNNEQLIQGKLK